LVEVTLLEQVKTFIQRVLLSLIEGALVIVEELDEGVEDFERDVRFEGELGFELLSF